jgi:hypothetical protein
MITMERLLHRSIPQGMKQRNTSITAEREVEHDSFS